VNYSIRMMNIAVIAGTAFAPSFQRALAQNAHQTRELIATCINRDGARPVQQRITACSEALESPQLAVADRAQILAARGEAYRADRDETQAANDLKQAVLLYDTLIGQKADPALLLQRGSTLHALGNRDLALTDYDQVIQLDPTNARALVERGKLGKGAEGEADKAATRALDPGIDGQFSAYGLN
jgi:tetratricopeptide (TPR) repeat protein